MKMPPLCRVHLTLSQKISIIEKSGLPGFDRKKIAEKYGVSKPTIASILKNKKSLLDHFDKQMSSPANKKKTMRKGKLHEVEQGVHNWIMERFEQGIPVSGEMMKQKAAEISINLGETSHNFSNGWMEKFKQRFNLDYKKFCGEKKSADYENAEKWLKQQLPEILSNFDPNDIYNCDETGLYFRGLPDRGFVPGSKKASGGKIPKERLTILFTCNMSGNHKLKPLIIGKSMRPRGFPRNIDSLPVKYASNGKAWMTSQIFLKFLNEWDRKLRLSNRKIALLLDNATCHPKTTLTNIQLQFLPPNTTSILQPLDNGIIKCFKGFYRSNLCQRILTLTEIHGNLQGSVLIKKISVLNAIFIANEAWQKVSKTTSF